MRIQSAAYLGVFVVLLCCCVSQAGTHIRSTEMADGVFYRDTSKVEGYCFQAKNGTESYDISMNAFLQSKALYPPEIPGLRRLDIHMTPDGKPDIRESDATVILALAARHPGCSIFRTADMGLFYVLPDGKPTAARKITITSENGDKVILWRNIEGISSGGSFEPSFSIK